VIAHNAVAFFHDGISVCTHGVPEPEQDLRAVAIDIYNNDIHVTGDDSSKRTAVSTTSES
jgi:hypothetical protein